MIRISVRYPDWITCTNWVNNKVCGALNVFDHLFPTRCTHCGRGM